MQRDKYARLTNQVNQLIDELTPSAPDFQLREACDQLVCRTRDSSLPADTDPFLQLAIMSDAPEMQVQLVSSHGMLAILEVLEGRCSRDVIMRLLQIINNVRLRLLNRSHMADTTLACAIRHRLPREFLLDWVRGLLSGIQSSSH